MKIIRNILICGIIVALGAGCASTVQYADFPDQTVPVEDPDKARIYVVRPSSLGGAVSMRVSDGEHVIGKTGPKGYLCWERNPGDIEIVGKAENTARLPLTVEAGTVYYVQQHVRMGILFARNRLTLLTEAAGKAEVSKCKPPKLGK